MGWFAWLGVMMPVLFGLNGWIQNIVLAWSGWTALWIGGLIGTFAIGYDSLRNVARFGLRGMFRPRFYFEVARLNLALLFLLTIPAITFGLFLPNVNLAKLPIPDFLQVRFVIALISTLFCFSAITGYLVSFVTPRVRRGRAYECTSWFFSLFGGMALVTYGYIAIPDPTPDIQTLLPGMIACTAGLALMIVGVVSELIRAKREEQCHAPEHAIRACFK